MKLNISHFAQIAKAEIDFGEPGDLTLLVGQQATGKSLVLQWLKLMCDRPKIREDWTRYGTNWRVPGESHRELDAFFGEGLGAGYSDSETVIKLDQKKFRLNQISLGQDDAKESVDFIPAQRALLMADGWPRPFSSYVRGTPYVARAQSERLVHWLSSGQDTFHGATVQVDRQSTKPAPVTFNAKKQAPKPSFGNTAKPCWKPSKAGTHALRGKFTPLSEDNWLMHKYTFHVNFWTPHEQQNPPLSLPRRTTTRQRPHSGRLALVAGSGGPRL